jgi:hypothetical protein
MNAQVRDTVVYLLKKGVDVSMVSLSTEVSVIQVYEIAIELFGEREDLVEALEINKKFYGVT